MSILWMRSRFASRPSSYAMNCAKQNTVVFQNSAATLILLLFVLLVMAVGFVDLPDDILLEISGILCLPKRLSPVRTVSRLDSLISRSMIGSRSGDHVLIPLSMTCSRLRSLYLPVIFRVMYLNDDINGRALQAPAILVHVHLIEVSRVPSINALASILRITTRVQEIYCRRGGEFHPMFLELPSLNRVTINDDCLPRDLILREGPTPSLLAFSMMCSPPWERFYSDEDLSVETAFVQSMLALSHQSLETVVLPADAIRVSHLAGMSWPCLQELAICGTQPPADFPLVCLLCMLPLLRVLTLSIAPRRGDPPFLVWPPETQLQRIPDLYRLERLTMSFPQARDIIFQHISLLDELSLRDTPRHYLRMDEWGHHPQYPDDIGYTWPGPLLTCAGALRIFQLCAPPNAAIIRRLELVVQSERGHFEAELYAQIAASCPRLRHFELHRYRDAALRNWDADASAIPVNEIAESLRAFAALRVLRLNLDLPPVSLFDDPDVQPREIERIARLVAATVPWLASVAYLAKDPGNVTYYWRTWTRDGGIDAAAQGDDAGSDLREYETWREAADFLDLYWF